MPLKGEIALVTGASRGIGLAIALELGRQGATVVGTATRQSGADNIGKALVANQVQGRGAILNVTDTASIDSLLKDMEGHGGMPSILVNNAGITRDNLLLRMSEEEWDAILDTNLKSVFRMTKACLRAMTKARKGRIISISSVVGATGNPGQVNYAAAKAGIVGFHQGAGARGWFAKHHGQCRGAGLHRHRHDPDVAGRGARGVAQADSPRAARQPRGHRRRRGVPGLTAGRLYHWHDPAR